MLSETTIASAPGLTVESVVCADEMRGWGRPGVRDAYTLVLVRAGRFSRRGRDGLLELAPDVAYIARLGEEERFAHPDGGGDECTAVHMTGERWEALAGERVDRSALYVDARLDLVHRRLLRATADPGYAMAEQLLELFTGALSQAVDAATPASAPPADRRAVAAAREALASGHPSAAGLFTLAAHLGVSPYRLSRAFPAVTGMTLTRYRNTLRVTAVLARLEAGETGLARLAAELGFADQAHLTRTVRALTGGTPTALRRLLA
ncbi:AraC family transcriptional regulator [Actinorhabdospora filicis]|uniref:AraC family transcriptional regulator n=1 Tax=Actinorhabdospora filicis TaxID=1785913 RepID=A0A9W6STH2_9ACTN|nr:helix-turn-helix transcriptional regulator [Actinorhabdospora filicis]GLZ81669.1 AraC family transcriptional regulator [Actinorhabdospora filicis]